MGDKPTYAELEQRLRELEAKIDALEHAGAALQRRATRHSEAALMAMLGHWELDLVAGQLDWSDEIYNIFDLKPREFRATYEAFLAAVHPADRAFVDRAYKESLRNRTGYEIVHRLKLRDGSIRYVREKCKTEYGDSGEPLRSLGTVQDITAEMRARHGFAGIISRDPRMHELFGMIRDLSDVNAPVLIQGESGTGKELVATAIHSSGCRAARPLVPVNCSALPEGLLESELFGHVRGAFTGAVRDKKGRFELADGGTLFLDEVADLPQVVQVKLLRVLQEGTFERVGGERTFSVDVRVVSAANRDLRREVEAGRFREDLFYRLNVVPIEVPPLRAHREDIPDLVQHFIRQACRLNDKRPMEIEAGAVGLLMQHDWPGNVRELKNSIERLVILAAGETIGAQDVQVCLPGVKPVPSDYRPGVSLKEMVTTAEREIILRALEQNEGQVSKTAQELQIERSHLYKKMRALGIDPRT